MPKGKTAPKPRAPRRARTVDAGGVDLDATPVSADTTSAADVVISAFEKYTAELARNTAAVIQLTAALRAKAGPVPAVPSGDSTPPAPAPKPTTTQGEYKAPRPCEGCGVNLDEPGVKHSAACTKVKPSGKTKSPDDLVNEAKPLFLAYAQAKGRDAAVALLGKFGAVKVSEIPVDKLPEFLAWLQANQKES